MTTKLEGMMIPGKLKWYVILALALWLALSGVAAAEQLYVNESGWWREGGAFNATSGTPIQAAVDAADAGDSIYVEGGNYYENVDVDKRLTLECEGADVVIVTAALAAEPIFYVTADYVNISRFAMSGAINNCAAGIYLYHADHCNISDNIASDNYCGIDLYYSSNNTLTNNTASNNCDGIWLRYSRSNTLISNTANSNNRDGFWVFGINKNDYNNSIDITNTVNGKPVYYFFNKNGIMLDGLDASHLTLVYCSDGTIKNSNVSNGDGIWLSHSSNNTLTNNTASDNDYGIRLSSWSSNNMLMSNNCSNNLRGISMSYSGGNTLYRNIADSNRYNGIDVFSSYKNDYNNSIDITNTVNGKPVYYFFNKTGVVLDGLDAGHLTLVYCSDCTIKNSNVSNGDGIYLSYSSNNTLTNNTANSNDWHGIHMWFSSNNNMLTSNNCSNNDNHGISLYKSSSNMLTSNNCSNNFACGIQLEHSSNNRLNSNNCSNNDADGIVIAYDSSNNMLNSNTANSNNQCSICVCSSNNTLISNTCSNNDAGGICVCSDNNTVQGNTADSNNYYGIYLQSSSNNIITCNWMQNNTQRGFRLYGGSTDNNISYNNIIENGNYNATSGGWEWQFYNDQSDPVEAKHNYWGAGINNSTIDVGIYDDEEGWWGEVEFYPFETDPVPCAPAPEELPAFTTADAVIALQIAAGSREYDRAMDVNDDGMVTSLDALMILQTVVGRIGTD